ncbi:T-cell surface glycoprotein CD1b-1-like [Felis catus]|uniref:T-cell surface glycoprotein CD1b-1-like n=1 Tax=Felis catus TaxID=9685 RepID=UPI001D1A229C|nr:T-cell surface glycoprotein CD1b-1-like [Felis catus]
MLLLQLVLLTVLVPGGDSDDDFQEPISFRTILTTSFCNHSWTQNQGSAWLDELQTRGWASKTGAFIFLWPWSRGNFSNEELMEQEKSFHTFSTRFPLIFQDHASQWQLECELGSLRTRGMEVACVCRHEFLLLLGKSLPWLLNISTPHHKTESHPCVQEAEARPRT